MGYRKLDPKRLKIIVIGIGVYGNKIAEKYFDEGFEYIDIYGLCTTNDYDLHDRYVGERIHEIHSISKLLNENTLVCVISDDIFEVKNFINDLNACDISGREPFFYIISKYSVPNKDLHLSQYLYFIVDLDYDIGMLSLRILLNHQNLDRMICIDLVDQLKQQEACNTQGVVYGFVNYDDEKGEKIARDVKNLCDEYSGEICGVSILMSKYSSLEVLDKTARLFSKYIQNLQYIYLGDSSSTGPGFDVCIVIYSNSSPLSQVSKNRSIVKSGV